MEELSLFPKNITDSTKLMFVNFGEKEFFIVYQLLNNLEIVEVLIFILVQINEEAI